MTDILARKPVNEVGTESVGAEEDLSVNQRAALQSGVNPEKTSNPVENPAAKPIAGPANTFISLTRDEKYKTEPNAGSIWICAGMSNALSKKAPANKQGIEKKTKKNPNLDASFITITAKSDIDDYLGLAKGSIGNAAATAAIALKSSNIRLVGTQGIKLITGGDVLNPKGGPADGSINGINIIAGNDDSHLQSMVKGENLVAFLYEVMDLVSSIVGTVEVLAKQQNDFNGKIKDHTHTGTQAAAPGTIPIFPLVPITTEVKTKVHKSKPVLAQGLKTTMTITNTVLSDLGKHKRNIENISRSYLYPTGEDDAFVLSRYNKVN